MESKYLQFEEIVIVTKKTKTFIVKNKVNGAILGAVKWSGAWRKYVFQTTADILQFDTGCLNDIVKYIDQLMNERKQRKEK